MTEFVRLPRPEGRDDWISPSQDTFEALEDPERRELIGRWRVKDGVTGLWTKIWVCKMRNQPYRPPILWTLVTDQGQLGTRAEPWRDTKADAIERAVRYLRDMASNAEGHYFDVELVAEYAE